MKQSIISMFAGMTLVLTTGLTLASGAPDSGVALVDAGIASTTPDAAPTPLSGLSEAQSLNSASDQAELSITELLDVLRVAVAAGHWTLAALAALMLIVLGIRAGADKFGFLLWFRSRWGGWSLVFSLSVLGMLVTTLGAGVPISWSLVSLSVVIALAGAGTLELLKDYLKRKVPLPEDTEEPDKGKE